MKQKLLNSFKLRVCLLVAVLCAGFTSAWGDEVTLTAGTNGSACKVNNQDGIKVGTSSKGGDMTITVPANTTKLTLHAAAWNGVKGLSLTISGATASPTSIALTANSGIANNSPFTLSGNESDFLFEVTLSGITEATAIKFTSSIAKRFVVWGASAVVSGGGSQTETAAAPTFSPAAGTYTSAQNVTLSTTTDGATIYYTTDGTTPTTSSNAYSTAIPVSSTTTIKAMATATGYDNSSVAEATYTILEHAGTEADPYTVADARAAIDANGTIEGAYVTGIISQIDSYNSNYNSITYWISDDGTTTGQLEVYSGKGLGNTNFNSVNDVLEGATVVVYGTLKKYNTTYEFDKNNYLTSYTAPAAAVEAPTFSPVAGTYDSNQSVTISTTTTGATIYYTTDGSNPTSSSNVYSSAISVSDVTTIKAIAIKGSDESTIATATYHICSAASPYTVTQALAFNEYPANGIYVTGIVSTAPTEAPSSGALTYYISVDGTTNDQLEVYKGKGLNQAAFTAQSDIQVGDQVTIYGNVKIYNGTTEFDSGNYLVAHTKVPAITAIDVDIDYDATSGEIPYSIDNVAVGTHLTSATTAADWVSNIVIGDSEVSFDCTVNTGDAARTATITLTYGEVTKDITVTQGAEPASGGTINFGNNGTKINGESVTGDDDASNTWTITTAGTTSFTQNASYSQVGKSDAPATSITFTTTLPDEVTITSFEAKFGGFNNTAGNVSLKVDNTEVGTGSLNGSSDVTVSSSTSASGTVLTVTVTGISKGVKCYYISYSTSTNPIVHSEYTLTVGNLSHVNLHIFDANNNSQALIDTEYGETTAQVYDGTSVEVSVDVESGYVIESLEVDGTDVADQIQSGEYVFTMPTHDVTITATAIVSAPVTGGTYVKVTSTDDLTDGQYLIVYEDGNVAFNGGLGTLDAVNNVIDVTINNDEITATSATQAAEFTIDKTAGTIKSASGYYIGATSYTNELKTSAENPYTNSISIDNGNAVIVVAINENNSVTLKYNKASNQNRFRYYKSGQEDIQLYKFVAAVEPYTPASITLNASGYATFSSTRAFEFPDATAATAWEITAVSGTAITFSQIQGPVVAGTGVLLKGTGSDTVEPTYLDAGNTLNDNKLVGITAATTIAADKYYGLSGNQFKKVNAGTVPAGKALLPYNVVNPSTGGNNVKALTFVFEYADGIRTVETVSVEEAAEIFNLAGQRLQKAQRGVNIINGKKVLVK